MQLAILGGRDTGHFLEKISEVDVVAIAAEQRYLGDRAVGDAEERFGFVHAQGEDQGGRSETGVFLKAFIKICFAQAGAADDVHDVDVVAKRAFDGFNCADNFWIDRLELARFRIGQLEKLEKNRIKKGVGLELAQFIVIL